MAGCTQEADMPEPFLSVEAEPATFGSEGGSALLNFKTNRSWNIAPDTIPAEEWCRITPPSGEGGEELSVTISVDPNEEYIARSLMLVLRSGTLEKRIPITQMKKNVILLDGDYRREVSSDGRTLSVTVRSNAKYNVMITKGDEWIKNVHAIRSSPLEAREHTFKILPSREEQQRTGTIRFQDTQSKLYDELTIVQSAWIDPDPERTALTEIYRQAGGASWTEQANWCSDKPLDQWYGVETDDQGHVTALRLGLNNLRGSIAKKIGSLSHLRHLDLSWNKLEGTLCWQEDTEICSDLDNLTNLVTIDLSHNKLSSDCMPAKWGNFKSLESIDLSSNRLSGLMFPHSWEQLFQNGRTVDLILNDNRLHGDVPDYIRNHPQWNRLALQFVRQYRGEKTVTYGGNIQLPDFTFTDLKDGSERNIRDVYGANELTMLLNWDPLQEESTRFVSTHVRRLVTLYGSEGFAVVAVTPEGDEYREAAVNYLQQYDVPWTAFTDYRDEQGRRIVLPDYPYPSYLLIDRKGKITKDVYDGQYIVPLDDLGEPDVIDMASNPFQHTALLGSIIKKTFGDSEYESTDYSMDKQYETLQKATRGKGIDLVLIGDAFTDIDIETGYYKETMQYAADLFFRLNPVSTYRDHFNVYMVYAVSGKSYPGREGNIQTALGTSIYDNDRIESSLETTSDYAFVPPIGGYKPYVPVVVNNCTAATSHLGPNMVMDPNYAFTGYDPRYRRGFIGTFIHESVGHCFGLLGDEYTSTSGSTEITDTDRKKLKRFHADNWSLNLSLESDPDKVYWSDLIGRSEYPYVGTYEGGFYYNKGVWRSEDKSIMSNTSYLYFNTICRQLLYRTIMDLSGRDYHFNWFLEQDSDEGRPANGLSAQRLTPGQPYRHHPPVVVSERR